MNREGQIPRSRGGICGVLLILLGLWGGLAPFVGPYIHFGYLPDHVWHYDSGRLYYSVIPGAAALLGGLLVTATRNRVVGIVGGLLAAIGGAWFGLSYGVITVVLKRTTLTPGTPIAPAGSTALRAYLETIALFGGLGVLILFVGALAVGRFSMVAAKDVAAAADADSYYSEFTAASSFPAAPPASQPDLGQYPTTAGQYPSATTGPFPAAANPFTDTTTGQFPPSDSGT
jgi:hypothetical protein